MKPKRTSGSARPRQRSFRAAFVVTVSVGAAATEGCDTALTTTDPQPLDCPEERPSVGDPCNAPGICGYTDSCGSELEMRCDGIEFEREHEVSCNPPPPTCPVNPPDEGATCDPTSDGPCEYLFPTACGVAGIPVSCDAVGSGTRWHYDPPACTPTTAACGSYELAPLCNADSTCRWLTPGCDDPMLTAFEAGCYPIDDCSATSCAANDVCTDISYDPCFQSTCEACGAPASLCLAQDG